MERPADKIYDVLKRYWGFTEFRPVQERIIRSVMDGRDTRCWFHLSEGMD